ncbi:16S rRNA (guanine(527)-N(7))-methyltransferase RsmG [Candidatus Sumerlaeota bacterium]|nr:16S rRNA (guanine(527)-N(7))-methyltransferase RsmG [Candidatus Sumerlaeota bacterium]
MTETPPERPFEETLALALDEMGLPLDPMARDQLRSFAEMLAESNRRFNLVADASPTTMAIKHMADSLLLLTTNALEGLRVRYAVDIGAGAGFPGIPLAIARQDITWLLIESTGKKARFLEELIFSLGLENVSISNSRSEELAHNAVKRESYDLAVIRGLAHCATLCELGLPFVKVGGRLFSYKGPDGEREAAESAAAAEACGGTVRPLIRAQLPIEHHPRLFIGWDKTSATPSKYPRREGVPQKSPIMG